MLKTIGSCIKFLLFSLVILILGNWIKWEGKTISDQVKIKMAHTEPAHIMNQVRGWAEKITYDARKGIQKKLVSADESDDSEIPSSERQKLKALIQELNSTHKKD